MRSNLNRKEDIPITSSSSDEVLVPPDDLWERLDAEITKDEPPPGSFWVGEIAKRYGKTYPQAQGIVNRMQAEGKIELVGQFGPHHTKYYRLKQ